MSYYCWIKQLKAILYRAIKYITQLRTMAEPMKSAKQYAP
jgi:hypothetical protein